jgi:hypothetical protein
VAVPPDCRICQGEAFDQEIGRVVVWSGPGMIDPAAGPLPPDGLAAMADRIRTALA